MYVRMAGLIRSGVLILYLYLGSEAIGCWSIHLKYSAIIVPTFPYYIYIVHSYVESCKRSYVCAVKLFDLPLQNCDSFYRLCSSKYLQLSLPQWLRLFEKALDRNHLRGTGRQTWHVFQHAHPPPNPSTAGS
jgi:hypothetical protein